MVEELKNETLAKLLKETTDGNSSKEYLVGEKITPNFLLDYALGETIFQYFDKNVDLSAVKKFTTYDGMNETLVLGLSDDWTVLKVAEMPVEAISCIREEEPEEAFAEYMSSCIAGKEKAANFNRILWLLCVLGIAVGIFFVFKLRNG